MASEFAFGRADAGDHEHVVGLHKAARPLTADPDALVVVVRGSRPGIAGFIGGLPEGRNTLCVATIAVAPEFRGLGIGRSLLAHFIDEAAGAGYSSVQVELCDREQELERLFAQQGFSPVAKTLRLPLVPTEERTP